MKVGVEMTTKSVAHCGTLTALAMIFGYVEALIPFHFGIPGVKLGLPNIITVFALYTLPVYQVFAIQVMLVSFLFGNLSMMLYSLAGGLLSLAVMGLLKKKKWLSIAGVSIAGGVSHNIGQLAVAVLVVQNLKIAFYLPALLASGLVTGGLIGMLVHKVKPLLDRSKF